MSSFKQLKERREARQTVPVSAHSSEPPSAPSPSVPANEGPSQRGASQSVASSSSTSLPVNPEVGQPGHEVCLEDNRDVQIKHSEGRGRGLFWCPTDGRRVGRGTTLLRLQPEVTVPSSASLESMCHLCFSTTGSGRPLQRCSGCKVLRYCSASCQKSDWPSHRLECKALQAFQKSAKAKDGSRVTEPGMTVRLMGRLVWERKRLGQEWWKRIEKLQSNRDAVGSDESTVELPVRLAHYLGGTQAGQEKMKELGFSNAAELLDLIGRATVNTFVAYSSDLTAIGIALSTTVAMINHSCTPNVAVAYPSGPGAKKPMRVVAIKDLESGDELTASYIDVSDPTSLRQRTLEKRFSFRCRCALCTKAERVQMGKTGRVDAREALWCSRSGCSGWVAVGRPGGGSVCTNCRQESMLDRDSVEATRREGERVLEKVEELMGQGNARAALDTAQTTVQELTRIQPPSAYPLLSLLRQLQTALILAATSTNDGREAASLFEEAVRFHFLSLAGMQASNGAVFSEGHPVRAITLATLSTLLVREVPSEEAEWVAANGGKSKYLSQVPSIPPVGRSRDQTGISLMVQAIKELTIAYGIEEQGGEPGRRLTDQVREWKESEAMARMTVHG